MAPPLKLTETNKAVIVGAVRAGNYLETAAAAGGIDSRTLREWLKKGAAGRQPFAAFREELLKAQAESRVAAVGHIAEAEAKDWRAAAWRLERSDSRHWGEKINVRIEEELERMLAVAERVLARKDFERFLTAIAEDDSPAEASGASLQ